MAKKAPTTKKKSTEKETTKHSKSVATKSTTAKVAAPKKSATVNAAKSAQSAKAKLKTVTTDKVAKNSAAKATSKSSGSKAATPGKTGTGSKIIETITGLLTGSKANKAKTVAEKAGHKKPTAQVHATDKDSAKVASKGAKPATAHKENQKVTPKSAKLEAKVETKHEAKHDVKNDKSKNVIVDKKKQLAPPAQKQVTPVVGTKDQHKEHPTKEVASKDSKESKAKGKNSKKGNAEEVAAQTDTKTTAHTDTKKGTADENPEVAVEAVAVKDHSETGGSPENFNSEDIRRAMAEINFFVSSSTDECSERHCDNLATTLGHCRLHYIANWKDLQKKKQVLSEGKLAEMVEDLLRRYPIKFMEAIRDDLTEEKTFYTILKNLNIDSGYDFDEPEDIDLDSDTDIAPEARAATVRAFEDDSDI